MTYRSDGVEFDVEYTESHVERPVLWESHCHTKFEMIAVTEGDVTVILEGQSFRIKKNRMIIVPPLFYHSVTANEKGSYHRVTALFGIDLIPSCLVAEFMACGRSSEIPQSLLERIKTVCQSDKHDFYLPLLRSLMVEFFYYALDGNKTAEGRTDEFLQKALGYIDEHLQEKILLDDLARHTSRSKSSFCHLFEERMNIPPKQYIIQKKLAIATKLIDEGMPHTEAAMKVGYENYSNFYRLYKKQKGLSH